MKSLPVLSLTLIFLAVIAAPALADNGPVNLSFTSLQEKGGFISGELAVTPLIHDGQNDGYLTLWLTSPTGDCAAARLLSWRHVALGNETRTVPILTAVPYAITPGTYQVTAIYGPGKVIPVACDKGPSSVSSLVITTPGQGDHDMAGSLPGEKSGSGPDYQIQKLAGVDTTVRVAPASTLQPELTITNAGDDDGSREPVEVHAYLGSDELIPVNAIVEPMKSGENRTVTLSFTVPEFVAQQSYPFFLIVDPQGEHGTADAGTNLKRTAGKMGIHVEDPGVDCGCK